MFTMTDRKPLEFCTVVDKSNEMLLSVTLIYHASSAYISQTL